MSPTTVPVRHATDANKRRWRRATVAFVAIALTGACTSSTSSEDDAAASEDGAPAGATLASVVFENIDGSAFAGSRTTFTLTDASGTSRLVAVEGTERGAATTVRLEPGTYRVAPSGDVQVSPTASYTVRDLSAAEIVVPEAEEGADLSLPLATVQFGLDVQRSPFDLRLDEVSATSAALTWEVIDGADVASFELRVTEGSAVATGRDDGVAVGLTAPTATSAAVDGLEPDREYTATLFASSSTGEELAFRSVSLRTAPADGSEPAFALAPNTILPADFDALDPRVVGDGLVAVTLGAGAARSSVTSIPGIDPDRMASGCVVGTPVLVSTEVAGDNAFYGVVGSCQEKPASWRRQQTAPSGAPLEETVALVDTGVPLAQVVPYLSFRSSGFNRCVMQSDAQAKDACATDDVDGDGVGDSTEAALGMDPQDPADNWERRIATAAPGPKPSSGAPITPIGDLQAPEGLANGPLQVTVLWATGDDLDLLVTDPAGAVVSARAPSTSIGAMDRDDDGDPTCISRDTRAENAVWKTDPAPGVYTIQVENFAGSVDDPRSACSPRVQARLEIRVGGVVQIERTITVGNSCPITIDVANGTVTEADYLAVACSYDGARWRTVSGFTDTNADGVPSIGDTISFFEHPTTFDGTEYAPIPMEDCVVTQFEAAFTGPPDLRVRGADCYVYFRSQEDPQAEYLQHRFGADNRRGGGKFDLDILDAIDWPKIDDRIEDAGAGSLVEQKSNRDDEFLRVDFNYVPDTRPNGWRRPLDATSTTPGAGPSALLAAPEIECESSVDAEFDPQIGMDAFHDVDVTLKYNKFTWDIEAGVTAYVEPKAQVEGAATCEVEIDGAAFQLATTPVPINLELTPTAGGSLSGTVALTGPRLALTFGVDTDGYVNAAIERCSPISWLPDIPCGLDLDADSSVAPIAAFTAGGVTGTLEGEIKASVGIEATIGVGVKNAFVTSKKGFAISLEPLVGTISASGSVTVVPPVVPPTTEDGATQPPEPTSQDSAPPYTPVQTNDIRVDQAMNPTAKTADGTAIVGPTTDGTCFDGYEPTRVGLSYAGKDYPTSECPDARCLDNDTPVFTYYQECTQARCYLGGAVVNAGVKLDSAAECPQRPLADATPPPAPAPSQPPTGPDDAAGDVGLCAGVSLGANLGVAFRAEFWVLGFGADERFPFFEEDITYPGAKFERGDCD